MNDVELQAFIEQTLMGRYAGWKPSTAQLSDLKWLCKQLDYSKAVELFVAWHRRETKHGKYPVVGALQVILKNAFLDQRGGKRGPCLVFALTRNIEDPRACGAGYRDFAARTMPGPDECLRRATYWRDRYIKERGGNWYIIRLWEQHAEPAENPRSTPKSRARILAEHVSEENAFAVRAMNTQLNREARAFKPAPDNMYSGRKAATDFNMKYRL